MENDHYFVEMNDSCRIAPVVPAQSPPPNALIGGGNQVSFGESLTAPEPPSNTSVGAVTISHRPAFCFLGAKQIEIITAPALIDRQT